VIAIRGDFIYDVLRPLSLREGIRLAKREGGKDLATTKGLACSMKPISESTKKKGEGKGKGIGRKGKARPRNPRRELSQESSTLYSNKIKDTGKPRRKDQGGETQAKRASFFETLSLSESCWGLGKRKWSKDNGNFSFFKGGGLRKMTGSGVARRARKEGRTLCRESPAVGHFCRWCHRREKKATEKKGGRAQAPGKGAAPDFRDHQPGGTTTTPQDLRLDLIRFRGPRKKKMGGSFPKKGCFGATFVEARPGAAAEERHRKA